MKKIGKGNYLIEKEKNTKKFLWKKRNIERVNENDEHGEENNKAKTKFFKKH